MKSRSGGPERHAKAFTLIELLVVISIIAVLAGILLSVLGRTKEQANIVKTMSNMKQMGVAMLSFATENNYVLPNRVLDGASDPKWPTVLKPYLQDLRVYSSPIADVNGKSYKVPKETDVLDNSTNNTSYIYNGMNDVGAQTNSAVTIRLNAISNGSETILLGIPTQKPGISTWISAAGTTARS